MTRCSAESTRVGHGNGVGRRKDEDRPILRPATSLKRMNKLSQTPWARDGDADSLMSLTLALRFDSRSVSPAQMAGLKAGGVRMRGVYTPYTVAFVRPIILRLSSRRVVTVRAIYSTYRASLHFYFHPFYRASLFFSSPLAIRSRHPISRPADRQQKLGSTVAPVYFSLSSCKLQFM